MIWPRFPLACVARAAPADREFHPDEDVWHLTLDQIESGTGRIVGKQVAPAAAAGSSSYVFDSGNVLYSKLRPYLNKVVRPTEAGIATTELVPLRPDPDILSPEFLAHYLRSPSFVGFASSCVAGAKMPRVIMAKFWGHEIPLPPTSEQRRIVEILDQADRLRRLRVDADAKAERILPALFVMTFGDPITNPMGWELCPLGQLTAHVTSGSRGWSEFVGRGDDLFVRTQDINDGEVSDELPALEPPAGAEADRTRLEPGDVVVTITGIVGKAAVFRGKPRRAYVSQHVALVRPKPTDLNPDFLASYANLPLGEVPVLARLQYGQTKPGLGFRELAAAQIPLPPISLQRAFAARVGSLQALRRHCHKAVERLEILWQSILTSAFSGNLTEGWREAHMKELLEEMEQQSRALAEVR